VEPLLLRLAPTGLRRESGGLGVVDIYVKSLHGVDPYFQLPMYKSMDGWWKVCFFLRSLHRDLVVHGASPGTPGHTTLGDAVLAPRFLGVTGSWVVRLLLFGSLVSPSLPINWGQVKDSSE
jgi:hypothetical protein